MSQEEYAVLNRTLEALRLYQLWPKKGQSFSSGNRYHLRYFLMLVTCSPLWIGTILHIAIVLKDNLEINISEDYSLISSLTGLHIIHLSFVWKQKKVALLYKHLSNFETFGKPVNFDKRNRQLNLFSKLFSFYCGFGILIYAIIAIQAEPKCRRTNEEKNLNEICGMFTPIWAPFNIDFFPLKQIAFAIQIYGIVIIIKGGASISFSSYEVAQHIVLRIEHLNGLLRKVFDDPDDTIKRRSLINCIRYHRYIIDIFELFDDCYKNCYGCYVIMTGIIFGCIAKQFVQESNVGALIHLGGWVFSLFFCCHAGQSVLSGSMTIAPAAFESKWYEAPVELQRDLLMLIMRSQLPFYHHATPIGTMTFSLFINLIKTSYSYFTLLNESM
ncbi:odorant receptor 82a [Asbolus verrucosus]|uniref:Odorant receptor n=1 Tax=Asbolus verrucosus TaxID=1661398 RepID=A0A482W8R1_ASBVE|nr:odorant receptor 82a [Asbolus verrucosus]